MVFCAEPAVHKVASPASPHVDDWRRFCLSSKSVHYLREHQILVKDNFRGSSSSRYIVKVEEGFKSNAIKPGA